MLSLFTYAYRKISREILVVNKEESQCHLTFEVLHYLTTSEHRDILKESLRAF